MRRNWRKSDTPCHWRGDRETQKEDEIAAKYTTQQETNVVCGWYTINRDNDDQNNKHIEQMHGRVISETIEHRSLK